MAEDVLAGRYDPPDDLFRKDRRLFAKEVRKLEDQFQADALRAVGLEDHPLSGRVLRAAQVCAGTTDRMCFLRCLVQMAELIRAVEEG